jgi:hypothetical protein
VNGKALRNVGLAIALSQARESGDTASSDAILKNNDPLDIIAGLIDTTALAVRVLEPESGRSLAELLTRIWESTQSTGDISPEQALPHNE